MAEESMKDFEREINASFRKIEVGDIISGTVIGIGDTEVTLDLNYFAPGIIKNENLSNDPGFVAAESLHYGQKISGKVVSMDDGNGNLELSLKEANDVLSWEKLKGYMEEKTPVKVKIREAVKGGLTAYVDGLRGFIPASQVSTDYVEDLSVYAGRELEVLVTEVDEKKKRFILSARVLLQEREKEERDHKIAMMAPGSIVSGKVESIMPYGAFISLGDGISGLCHISQVSQKRVNAVGDVLKVGQEVRAKILNTNDGKVSLSIRAVEEAEAPAKEEKEKKERNAEIEKYADHSSIGTSLGDLLKGLKLDGDSPKIGKKPDPKAISKKEDPKAISKKEDPKGISKDEDPKVISKDADPKAIEAKASDTEA